VLLAFVRPAAAHADPPGPPLRIGRISISTVPLFSQAEAARGPVYRLLNALHVPSRPELIRKFLVFHEGEAYDPAKVEESERALRALDFLKTVKITAGEPHDGAVDITIETQDQWTTDPNADFSHGEGINTYTVDLTQKNLFGTGAEASFTAAQTSERSTRSVELATPALITAAWNADLLWAHSSDGGEKRLLVNHPFSSRTRWTLAFSLDALRQETRLYQLTQTVAAFAERHRELTAEAAWAFQADPLLSRRLLLGFDNLVDRFAPPLGRAPGHHRHPQVPPPSGELPANRRFHWFYIGYEEVVNDFIKLDYVNKDLREEDFNLGRQLAARFSLSPHTPDPLDDDFRVRLEAGNGWRQGPDGFLLVHAGVDTRIGDRRLANFIATASLLEAHKIPGPWRQTLVARLDWTAGKRLDRDIQFLADALTGLRAYPVHAYSGDKRLLLNVEDRFFLGREVAQLFAPGAAVFFDAGTAEPAGTSITFRRLHADIGAGLRFGIARADATQLRLDLAYRLDRDATGHRGLVLSFGTRQAF
jgi:hypothetical protein